MSQSETEVGVQRWPGKRGVGGSTFRSAPVSIRASLLRRKKGQLRDRSRLVSDGGIRSFETLRGGKRTDGLCQ